MCIRYKNSKNVLHLIFLTFVSKQFQTCRKKIARIAKIIFFIGLSDAPK